MARFLTAAWAVMLGASVSATTAGAAPLPAATYDVVVYGGTSGGVMAAVQSARMGKKTVLVEPTQHLGGLTSGGLGWVDVGKREAIGGLATEYFHRVWEHYHEDSAWKWDKKHPMKGQGVPAETPDQTMWVLEPHVAETLFDQFAAEAHVTVVRGERLDRQTGVQKQGERITAVTMESGLVLRGGVFIDATYEGDLMAAAGVSYIVGSEANATFQETLNGVRFPSAGLGIDPYIVPGNPSSGLLPRVAPGPGGSKGEATSQVQAYCYRLCLTNVPENRVPIPKPADYDERQYEIILRAFEANLVARPRYTEGTLLKFTPMPNRKTDSNNGGPISTDYIGMSDAYAEATYAVRARMAKEHEQWQRGLLWTLQNSPRLPPATRAIYEPWGLAKDEFADTDHWPSQLYVREARRMRGEYVITEHDCRGDTIAPDPVGMGSYTMDSHNMRLFVAADKTLGTTGGLGEHLKAPYPISYRSLLPKRAECVNLLVPVCLSVTHAAYGSVRMEPVFMVLGQSAGTAAALAVQQNKALQDLDYHELRERLLQDKQVLP